MLDNRLITTTQHLDNTIHPSPLTNTSSYISLYPKQTVYYSAQDVSSSAFNCIVPINMNEGIYEAILQVSSDSGAYNWAFGLYPNNSIYTSSFTIYGIIYDANVLTTTIAARYEFNGLAPAFWSDSSWTSIDQCPVILHIILTSYIDKKQISTLHADDHGITVSNSYWLDTTTPWTKFGTIWFNTKTSTNVSFLDATFNIEGYIKRII